jgi:hypothetical protein
VLPPPTCFYKFNCCRAIIQKIIILVLAEFVIFFIVDDAIAYQYRCVVPAGRRLDANGIPVISRKICVVKFHKLSQRLNVDSNPHNDQFRAVLPATGQGAAHGIDEGYR